MKVRVQFFSRLKDVAGASDLEIELAEQSTVAHLLALLYRSHLDLGDWDSSILIGAGLEFVGRDYVIKSGDEIALMPPVQGG